MYLYKNMGVVIIGILIINTRSIYSLAMPNADSPNGTITDSEMTHIKTGIIKRDEMSVSFQHSFIFSP